MKNKPTWISVVGVLGIIFSCFGILGAAYDLVTPAMMEMQKEMFAQIESLQPQAMQNQGAEAPPEAFYEMFKSMEKMWETPEWFKTWSISIGLVKLVLCGFSLLACIFLLQIKPVAVKLFYCSAGLNIGLALVKIAVMLASMSFMAMTMMIGGFFGLVVNIVLIIVVATNDKSAFNPAGPPPLAGR